LNVDGAEAVVLSACVQMPSLGAIPIVEDRLGLPVTSASVCTTRKMLEALKLQPVVPDAGALLSSDLDRGA
jgi:maleate isomerase